MRRLFIILALLQFCVVALIAAPSTRIVTLAQSLTRNLVYLGAENDIVGCTSYCITASKKEIVASSVKVNVEKVLSLKPNLVVATTLTSREAIATLRKFGINVVVYPTANSFEEVCTQFLDLGKKTGRSAIAVKIINETRRKVAKLKSRPAKHQKMFIQIGANPLYAVIPNTYMDDYITFSGSKNIAYDMTSGNISRETVLQRNPDVIFVVTMGLLGNAQKKQWESVRALSAVRNRKVFILDSDKACNPSPISFVETLETIINLSK